MSGLIFLENNIKISWDFWCPVVSTRCRSAWKRPLYADSIYKTIVCAEWTLGDTFFNCTGLLNSIKQLKDDINASFIRFSTDLCSWHWTYSRLQDDTKRQLEIRLFYFGQGPVMTARASIKHARPKITLRIRIAPEQCYGMVNIKLPWPPTNKSMNLLFQSFS